MMKISSFGDDSYQETKNYRDGRFVFESAGNE